MADDTALRITTAEGVATIWLDWPGRPVNGWNLPRLTAFDHALSEIAARPDLEILVVRSARPGGFCGGFAQEALAHLRCDSDAAGFALSGQRVLRKLKEAPQVTLALIEGPCLGPGFELALACDYRMAVEGPNSRVGFGEGPTGWGGRTLWRQLTGAVAPTVANPRSLRIFDGVCCERRAKIDLQTRLDLLLAHPVKPRLPLRSWFVDAAAGLAEERRHFVRTRLLNPEARWPEFESANAIPAFPKIIGLVGNGPRSAALAWDVATRGARVIRLTDDGALPRPNRMTPLEWQLAERRIAVAASVAALAECGLVLVDDSGLSPAFLERKLPARTILAVAPADSARFAELSLRPGRVVGLEFAGDDLAVVYPARRNPSRRARRPRRLAAPSRLSPHRHPRARRGGLGLGVVPPFIGRPIPFSDCSGCSGAVARAPCRPCAECADRAGAIPGFSPVPNRFKMPNARKSGRVTTLETVGGERPRTHPDSHSAGD